MLSRESLNILDRYSVHSSQISDGKEYQNYKKEKFRLLSTDVDHEAESDDSDEGENGAYQKQ